MLGLGGLKDLAGMSFLMADGPGNEAFSVCFNVSLTVTVFMFNPWTILRFLLRGLAHQCGQNPLGAALCIVSSHTVSVNQGLGERQLLT